MDFFHTFTDISSPDSSRRSCYNYQRERVVHSDTNVIRFKSGKPLCLNSLNVFRMFLFLFGCVYFILAAIFTASLLQHPVNLFMKSLFLQKLMIMTLIMPLLLRM